jgi:hypothetical protein
MPFQAIAIALRANPGDPASKLALIYLTDIATIDDTPNGTGWASFQDWDLARFCQIKVGDVPAVLDRLVASRSIFAWYAGMTSDPDHIGVDLQLPMSDLRPEERKRIKATPDQLQALLSQQAYRCRTCQRQVEVGDCEVDHIIPRSLGGADVEGNCQAICKTCNGRKGAKLHFVDFLGGRHGG